MARKQDYTARERAWMQRALALARRGWGQTAPNPMVGAVVVRGGRVVAEGWHVRYGGPHAEVMALRRAGAKARGATVYVTLEPCAHWGKTPPCVDALIAAGVSKVVCAMRDPGHLSGGGARELRRAGIAVKIGLMEAESRELNASFIFAAKGATRPWITLKLALSADGAVAKVLGKRTRITGPAADAEVHRMRAQSDAVAVGRGTVVADNPRLTVRHGKAPRIPPVRVVFDRSVRIPVESRLVTSASRTPTLIIAGKRHSKREFALFERGVEVLRTKNIRDALQTLRNHEVRCLLVEGGPTLARSLLAARVVDRLVIFRSPRSFGSGPLAAFDDASLLDRYRVVERRRCGVDWMTTYDTTPRGT